MYEINSSHQQTEAVVLSLQPESESEREIEFTQSVAQGTVNSEQFLGQLLSQLLKYGVLTASTIVLIGGILYLICYGFQPVNYQVFHGATPQLCSPTGVVNAALSGNYRGIIQLGLLILIATPVIRVAISLIAFLRRRDLAYIIITSFVLAGLTYSLLSAYYRLF